MNSGIYIIKNIVNNKCYIGSSCNLKTRFRQHKLGLKNNKHFNLKLQNAYNKYGVLNFEFTILELCNRKNLIIKEQHYFDTLKPIYNINPVAYATLNTHITEVRRQILSVTKSGVNNPNSKLTVEQVKEIRASSLKQNELAKLYNISRSQICNLINYKSYKNI